MGLNWEDPPPETPTRNRWTFHAKELKANPGKWAKFGGIDSSLAYRINRGDYPAFPSSEYEVALRREGLMPVLYIRYVGKE